MTVVAVLVLSMAASAGAAEEPAASAAETQAQLKAQLSEEVFLRLALGDGRRAAAALITLATVAPGAAQTRDAAKAVLDAYESVRLGAAVREQLESGERAERAKATPKVADALRPFLAEHKIPAELRGRRKLGPADGCPVPRARVFAEGGGVIWALSDSLASFDGARWQVRPDFAVPVSRTLGAVFVDTRGRLWVGGGRAARQTERPPRSAGDEVVVGNVAVCESSGPGGRWRTFDGGRRIASFAENADGVWVATPSQLLRFDGRHLRPVDCPLPYSPFRKLLASPKSDALWVVDLDRISVRRNGRWESYSLGKTRVIDAALMNGKPVVGTARGLRTLDATPMAPPEGTGTVVALAAAPDGTLWCVTDRGSVLSTDLNAWRIYEPLVEEGATLRSAPAVHCDAAGRLWLSTGRGLEVRGKDIVGRQTPVADRPAAKRLRAPLVSAAGSAGWATWAQPMPERRAEADEAAAEDDATASADDLAAFEEDEGEGETPEAMLAELRKSPNATGLFRKLMALLDEQPDAKIRRAAFDVAAEHKNAAFYGDAKNVRAYAEMMLDDGRPVEATKILLGAANATREPARVRTLGPALYEALVAMGFGEFARPGFLIADAGLPLFGGLVERHAPDHRQEAQPATARLALGAGIARERLLEAKLGRAVILADKRAVLGSIGSFERWKQLVEDCVELGDAGAAARYRRLTKDLFKWPAAADKPDKTQQVDSVALSPFRWIRRIRIKRDGGFGPAVGGDWAAYIFDEGASGPVAVGLKDGKVTPSRAYEGAPRSILASKAGVQIVVRRDDGRLGVHGATPVADSAGPTVIAGLTDGFDGFSATPIVGGVFYCFDDGLTKVDLKAKKVVWRNRGLAGGASPWRTLLGRALPVPDGRDVFVVVNRKAVCVDANSGKVRWATPCNWAGTPAVVGDVVVVGAGRREVWGLDRKTGKRAWKHLGRASAVGRIVSEGKRVFYAMPEGDVAALSARDGGFLWRRPTQIGLRRLPVGYTGPTAMLVRGERLVACNRHGYIEFDSATGAIHRRLDLTTARPMAATGEGVIVMTAPGRLVAVADTAPGDLGTKMLALAHDVKKPEAAAIARVVATCVDPSSAAAHGLALKLSAGAADGRAAALTTAMIGSVDPFAPATRKLMREHLERVPWDKDVSLRIGTVVASAHVERGGLRQAAESFAKVSESQPIEKALIEQLRLELAAGEHETARQTARRLAAIGLPGAHWAVYLLAGAGRTDDALDVALTHARVEDKDRRMLFEAVELCAATGRLNRGEELLARASGKLGFHLRAQLHAHMMTTAGVVDRALPRREAKLRARLETLRELLAKRIEVLKAREREEEAKLLERLEERAERLKQVPFP